MPTENYIESLEAGQRWHVPADTRETERSVLLSCWQMNPVKRPKMGVLSIAYEHLIAAQAAEGPLSPL